MTLHWALLVHEKLAVIATFAYSQVPLQRDIEKRYIGEKKFLNKIAFELPGQQVTQALMDFALYFRTLDEEQGLTDFLNKRDNPEVGTLVLKTGDTKPLSPREMANKIIHAEKIQWDFTELPPKIVCTARDNEQWLHATIEVWKMLEIGGRLGS
jgi:hypothetical protein